jgi:hypothetical protein
LFVIDHPSTPKHKQSIYGTRWRTRHRYTIYIPITLYEGGELHEVGEGFVTVLRGLVRVSAAVGQCLTLWTVDDGCGL